MQSLKEVNSLTNQASFEWKAYLIYFTYVYLSHQTELAYGAYHQKGAV